MTKGSGVERWDEPEEGYSSMIKNIVYGKTGSASSLKSIEKLLETASARVPGRAIRYSPEDYWHFGNVGAVVVDVSDELADVRGLVDDLSYGIESLKTELLSCKECINRVSEELSERPIVKETWLLDIDEDIEVLQPIPVVIEEYNDEVIATFPEIEVFGVGSGEAEAIRNLKEEIRKILFELENISDDKLGKLPLSWKRVLLKVVKNIGDDQ